MLSGCFLRLSSLQAKPSFTLSTVLGTDECPRSMNVKHIYHPNWIPPSIHVYLSSPQDVHNHPCVSIIHKWMSSSIHLNSSSNAEVSIHSLVFIIHWNPSSVFFTNVYVNYLLHQPFFTYINFYVHISRTPNLLLFHHLSSIIHHPPNSFYHPL